MALLQFLFILAVPLVLVAGAVVTLFAVGALFDALEHPDALRGRIEGVFRRPLKAPKLADKDHYYQPYWKQS